MKKHRVKGTVPNANDFRALGLTRPANEAQAEQVLLERYEEQVVAAVRSWIGNFMIQIKADDQINGKCIVELPPLHRKTVQVKLLAAQREVVRGVIL